MVDWAVETGNCWEASNRILETAQLGNLGTSMADPSSCHAYLCGPEMLIQLTLSFSSAKQWPFPWRVVLKTKKIFVIICYIIGSNFWLFTWDSQSPHFPWDHRRWSSPWASWAVPQIFCVDSDPGKCRSTFPGLPISLVSYCIWLPSAMSKSQGSCSWQRALCCQQLLTGETHWPKIRKLACTAKGPTSPVSCHSQSFYTAPLQEMWYLVQESVWNYEIQNEVMAVCLLACVVFLRTAFLSVGTFRNGFFHGTLEPHLKVVRLTAWLKKWGVLLKRSQIHQQIPPIRWQARLRIQLSW